MNQIRSSRTPKRPLEVDHKSQTDLSAWRKRGRTDPEKSSQNHQPPGGQKNDINQKNDVGGKNDSQEVSLEKALSYFEKVQGRVSLRNNSALQKHLAAVESIALQHGLPPESFEILLNVVLSGKFADTVNTRLLKSLIPASVIPENSVVTAVSWLCTNKSSGSIQLLFLRWLITVFDFIDHKEQVNALYGFFFFFLQDEKLCPYVCHVLYLLTRKENVKPFRVRRLLDLQAKMGMQPHLQALLSLYKLFCPELVTITLPTKTKTYFKNSEGPWKAAMNAVRQRNQGSTPLTQAVFLGTAQPQSRKRKWNTQLVLPASSARNSEVGTEKYCDLFSTDETFPVEQLQTFPQLLQNIHRLEFPSQMGSVLTNPLLLHYMNCVRDESIYLRLYYWMGQMLQEECTWCVVDNTNETEFKSFLETIYKAECFLQEGFPACEEFLYKSLPLWDGSCCRPEILKLVSWIPLSSSPEIKSYLYGPLAQLFFTSSLYFKCSVLESLKELLENWLNCNVIDMDPEFHSLNTTLSGLVTVVADLIHFVGRLSTVGLRLEKNSTLLLIFILDFYETVCDMYLKYNLPLLILPPAGVFYPALLSMDSVTLNQLCYIMYRYRTNLVAAKENEESKKKILQFKFSNETYREYNQYITAMVGCLWTSTVFQKDTHPQGLRMDEELLNKTLVKDFKTSFNIVYHPAMLGYSVNFLKQICPEDTTLNFKLIKGKRWDWYLEYLYAQGLEGLKVFIESSINRVSQASRRKAENVEA
ncbi:centromere protein I [Manacus candei]|uniref:centromere protein I n=1 Tax=Manacus candei TaxID=415023 RepID=UPI002226EBB6|nr:centromere protein I [Manacus candei]